MTGREIYKKTLALMIEKPTSTIYDNQVIDNLNKVLTELFRANNMYRMFYGKVPFIDEVKNHLVSKLDDEIDYEDEIQQNAIPSGLASKLYIDDDLSKKSIYDGEYNNAREDIRRFVSKEKIKRLTKEAQNAL